MNTSCPAPSKALDSAAAKAATRLAPATPAGDAAGDPAAAAEDALGRRQHDADDQAGLHRLAEDDDQADEHAALFPVCNCE